MLFTLFLFSRSCALPCHSNLLLNAVAATQIRPNVRSGSVTSLPSYPRVRFTRRADSRSDVEFMSTSP
jgi:hypothetical protein